MKVGVIRRKLDFSVIKEMNELPSEVIKGICGFAYNITMVKEDPEKVIRG